MKNAPFPDTPALDDFFAPHDYAAWRAVAEKLLKGAPFEKRLLTSTPEEITLQPLYSQETHPVDALSDSLPGFAPFLRGRTAAGYHGTPWLVLQELPYENPAAFNAALLHALNNGQNAVLLQRAHDTTPGTRIDTLDDLATALQGVDLTAVPIYLQAGHDTPALLDLFLAWLQEQAISPESVHGGFAHDPIAAELVNPQPSASLSARLGQHAGAIQKTNELVPGFRTVFIDTTPWHNAGGSAVQELAFGLAAVVDITRRLLQSGMAVEALAGRVHMRFAVDSRFFMQIAKLRAARILFARAMDAFGGAEPTQRFFLHACTSRWNKTVFDPHVNLLRATAEAQAAVLAGCDSLSVSAFDALVREANEFSTRLARNLHAILREESHLDRVIDAAGGAWAIEQLTRDLAEKAWDLFQETEKEGGLIPALQDGRPQQQVIEKARERRQAIDMRATSFIGTTVYADIAEKPLSRTAEQPVSQTLPARPRQEEKIARLLHNTPSIEQRLAAALAGATIAELSAAISLQTEEAAQRIRPLPQERAVEHFEAMRRAMQKHKQTHGDPTPVFLAVFGSLAEYKARADFITDFFNIVEFPVLPPEPHADIRQTAAAAHESGTAIVVLCAPDARYGEIVPEFMRHFSAAGADAAVYIAGQENEALAQSGVSGFIHRRSDAAALLKNLLQKTGVLS